MMRPLCALALARRIRPTSHPRVCIISRFSLDRHSGVASGWSNIVHRQLSDGGVNGDASAGNDIVDSAAATMQWKRNHYRQIEEKFSPQQQTEDDADGGDASAKPASTQQSEPMNIEKYEDVQPMWKEMESRVTRRRSLTSAQRGGVSGRRNVRKSDEDVWLQAGVYDSDDNKGSSSDDDAEGEK